MLRNLDQVQLRDVDLRCPDSPLAKKLRQRFYDMLRCNVKLGKRTLSEFCPDESTPTYSIHVLASSDGQRLALRAKLLYDPIYLRVPVVEDGKVSPWNKPAFEEICKSAMRFSMLAYKFIAQAFFPVLAARIVDPTWKDMPGYIQFMKARVVFWFWPTVGRNRMPSRWHWNAQLSGVVWCNVQRTNVSNIAGRFWTRRNLEWLGATCKEPMSATLRAVAFFNGWNMWEKTAQLASWPWCLLLLVRWWNCDCVVTWNACALCLDIL